MTRLEQERQVVQQMQRDAGWTEHDIKVYAEFQDHILKLNDQLDENGDLKPGHHLGASLGGKR